MGNGVKLTVGIVGVIRLGSVVAVDMAFVGDAAKAEARPDGVSLTNVTVAVGIGESVSNSDVDLDVAKLRGVAVVASAVTDAVPDWHETNNNKTIRQRLTGNTHFGLIVCFASPD